MVSAPTPFVSTSVNAYFTILRTLHVHPPSYLHLSNHSPLIGACLIFYSSKPPDLPLMFPLLPTSSYPRPLPLFLLIALALEPLRDEPRDHRGLTFSLDFLVSLVFPIFFSSLVVMLVAPTVDKPRSSEIPLSSSTIPCCGWFYHTKEPFSSHEAHRWQ